MAVLFRAFLLFLVFAFQTVFADEFQLKERHPAWQHKIVSTYQDGSMEKVLLLESGTIPKKLLVYYPSGAIRSEADLSFDMKREGFEVFFFEDNQVGAAYPYKKGKLDGLATIYAGDGAKLAEEHWKDGARHGLRVEYYADGGKKSETFYVHGLITGQATVWDEKEKMIAKSDYVGGLLHGTQSEFYSDGTVKKTHLVLGKRHGKEVIVYGPTKVRAETLFENGKKEGRALQFSQSGTLIGEGMWHKGLPVGAHFLKFENGSVESIVKYDDKGVLKEPLRRYSKEGKIVFEGDIEGTFQEWYDNGQLKRKICQKDGAFDGEQKSYFPSGRVQLQAHFSHGVRDGATQEWYENGQAVASFTFKNGKKEGKGESYYNNGQLSQEAFFVDGVPRDSQFFWHANGKKKAEIHYKNKKIDGARLMWDEAGVPILQEYYEEDTPCGSWKEWYGKDKPKSSKTFVKGRLEGSCTTFYEDGLPCETYFYKNGLLEGEQRQFYPLNSMPKQLLQRLEVYKDGKLHGTCKKYWENGQLQMAVTYSNGMLDGKKTIYDPSGAIIFDGTYEKGLLCGKMVQKKENGRREIQYFKNGIPEGEQTIYFSQDEAPGKIKAYEATYEKGKLEGKATHYYVSGAPKAAMPYKNGKLNGVASSYNEEGKLLVTIHFENDKQHGPMRYFYPGGALAKELSFVSGLQEGLETSYFENGMKSALRQYKNGKLDGTSKEFNEQGVCVFLGEYQEGFKQGRFDKYSDNGQLLVEERFEKDLLVYKKNATPCDK